MAQQIQLRHDTAANWTSVNPTLMVGELGYETDTKKYKVGDGSTAWVSLGYLPISANLPTITLTGDITGSASGGSIATTIGTNKVSNTNLAQMAANSIKGNNTGGTANAADLTAAQVTAMLNLFSSTLQGLVPASAGGTTNYLRADGSWASVSGSLGVSTKTANYTLLSSDDVILGDATSGAITLTLPLASSVSGKVFRLKKIDSSTNAITIARTSTDTFDGVTSKSLTAQYQEMAFVSNGTNWYRIELSSLRSEICVYNGNGFGSTNTAVRRFSTTSISTGSAITYADSATAGGSFTINEDGVYTISISDTGGVNDYMGASRNGTSLNTTINGLSRANGKILNATFSAGLVGNGSVTLKLSAGDVIRMHGSATTGNYTNSSENTMFYIVKVSN